MQTPPREQALEKGSQLPTMLEEELLCRAEAQIGKLMTAIEGLILACARPYTQTRHFSTTDLRMMLWAQVLRMDVE